MNAAALKSFAAVAVTALSLLVVPSGVGAATVPLAKKTQNTYATDFLTQTLSVTPSSSPSFKPLGLFIEPVGGGYSPAGVSSSNPFSTLQRMQLDSSMSNLAALVISQQSGRSFDFTTTSLDSVYSPLATNPASAVPLPASAWLFVVGLMGLLGARVTGIGRERSEAVDNDVAAGADGEADAVDLPALGSTAPQVPRRRPAPPRVTARPYGSAVPA
jgi:hypothetical protein